MSETLSLRLEGRIVAESPLATSPPNTPIGTPKAPSAEQAPSPIPRMTIMIGGSPELRPYFPGSGIRGKLRRAGLEVVRRGVCEAEGMKFKFSLPDYYYLSVGGIKGAEKEEKTDIAAAADRRMNNPLIALFGAGSPWDHSRLSVSHAIPSMPIPVERTTVVRGVRMDDISRGAVPLENLAPEAAEEWLRKAEERKAEVAADKQAEKERKLLEKQLKTVETNEEKDAIKAKIAELSKKAEVSALLPLPGYEAIPQGTELTHSFTLRDVRTTEVGLFIAALDNFALDPFVGGRRAHGCGQISGEWNVSVRRGSAGRFENIGGVELVPFKGVSAPQELMDYAEEFNEVLADGLLNFRAPRG